MIDSVASLDAEIDDLLMQLEPPDRELPFLVLQHGMELGSDLRRIATPAPQVVDALVQPPATP